MSTFSENQKRWTVVGIALLNKMVPQIRTFVEQCLLTEYHNLKTSHNIHMQTAPGFLRKHPKTLKYENINNNNNHKLPSGKLDVSKFDYKVLSHVDLSKLYLQPFMVKFSAFDDKCDGSAVLLLLGEVPVFSAIIQASAKAVKDNVRNEWAHCNLTVWDEAKFKKCFQEMKQLVNSLCLPTADEDRILSELQDWETKGSSGCHSKITTILFAGLLIFHEIIIIIDEVAQHL